MIPPIMHRIWLGSDPIPGQFEEYWQTFMDMNPRWTFLTWTDGQVDNILQNKDVFDFVDTYSEKSDVMRFEILRNCGGIYVDVDVEPLKPWDKGITATSAFAGWEYDKKLGTAVMGGEAMHPALDHLVKWMPDWVKEHEDAIPALRTGPAFLSGMWWKRQDVTRFPRDYFYPYCWFEMEKLEKLRREGFPPESYVVHHWEGSWRKDK